MFIVGVVRGTFANETSTFMITATPTVIPTPQPPKVTTGEASLTEDDLVILEGLANANGLLTTVWFEYGTSSGVYTGTSSTQTVGGTNDTNVRIGNIHVVGNVLEGVIYYYRLGAQNSIGTSYGDEKYFGLVP